MIGRFLLCLYCISVFGADIEAVQRKISAMIQTADKALASGQIAAAEDGYKSAIRECDSLPPDKYHCKTDGLWKLARLYSHEKDAATAESVYKERLAILLAHQEPSGRPDLDVGIALFDLQSVLEAADLSSEARDDEAIGYVERARSFYEQCKARFPDLWKTCDRRLADVEGGHGTVLALKKHFDEAVPFLKSVIDRPDSGVRTDVIISALVSYSKILISRSQSAEAQQLIDRAKRLSAQK
jgi:tetratricopeptide (TPR) repeat protein